MKLLDLPPELFQHIVHDAVSGSVNFHEAWKLRLVCRTFAAEVEYYILTTRPISDFATWNDRNFLGRCLHRYLAQRLASPKDIDQGFLDKLQSLVNWVIEELDIKEKREVQETTERVCAGLVRSVGRTHLVEVLHHDYYQTLQAWSTQPIDAHDKAIAALAVESYILLHKTLPQLDSRAHHRNVWCKFEPFEFALIRKDKALLCEILKYKKGLATAGGDMHELEGAQGSIFSINAAVKEAILSRYREGLQDLLKFHQAHLPRPTKLQFEDWMNLAAYNNARFSNPQTEDYVSPVLNLKPNGYTARQLLILICHYPSASAIQAVLASFDNDIDDGSILTLPIFIAVRSKNPRAINAVLDAGANVDITALSNVPSLGTAHVTPLEIAIHKHGIAVINVLLNRGAPVPTLPKWPTHARTYNCLRNYVMNGIKTKKTVPTLKQFK